MDMPGTLWCYQDEDRWGEMLYFEARRRGLPAALFKEAREVTPGDVAFVHMHHAPNRRDRDKDVMRKLAARGVRTIPEPRSGVLYDDKAAQARELGRWMPRTLMLKSATEARAAIGALGFPFMSKASEGASSHNVRLVKSREQAEREVQAAFSGSGLKAHFGQRQRGYLLWQEFCAGNDYDYRVIAIGRQRMMLRRYNRADRPMASGSGKLEPVTALDAETREVLAAANAFFEAEGFTWCGIDMVRDAAGRWVVLETTVGWTARGYVDCAFVGTERTGADVWGVLIDEIAAGSFAGSPAPAAAPVPAAPPKISRAAHGPVTVIGWKWNQPGHRFPYLAGHANAMDWMLRRHCSIPYRFVLITDDPAGVECETYPLWDDHAEMVNACGDHLPSCYRRLRLFSREMRKLFGPKVVSVDLDAAIVGDPGPVWDRPESFLGWAVPGTHHERVFNGSMFLMRTGAHADVWERFDPAVSPAVALHAGYLGSDQAWMSYRLAATEAGWTQADGVHSYFRELQHRSDLPPGARVVFFEGKRKPWHAKVRARHPWVAEHYPLHHFDTEADITMPVDSEQITLLQSAPIKGVWRRRGWSGYVPAGVASELVNSGRAARGAAGLVPRERVAEHAHAGPAGEDLVSVVRLMSESVPGDFTSDGKPSVTAMRKYAGRAVTADERDRAWARLQAGA